MVVEGRRTEWSALRKMRAEALGSQGVQLNFYKLSGRERDYLFNNFEAGTTMTIIGRLI